jgi:hypothetical protein
VVGVKKSSRDEKKTIKKHTPQKRYIKNEEINTREKKCWSEKRAYRVIKRVRVRERERERSTKLFVTL